MRNFTWVLGLTFLLAAFTLSALAQTQVSVVPSAVAFGKQSLGILTCPDTVTVTNGGGATVTLTSASTLAPFAVTGFSGATPIAAGGSLSLGVTYSPAAAQTDNGTLTLSFDLVGPLMVALSGTGVNTDPSASPEIPLIDMGQSRTYLGFSGGLYDGGCNSPPSDQDAIARGRAALITPLTTSGSPDAVNGKMVLESIGMSINTFEWCGTNNYPPAIPCPVPTNNSFMAQAAASSQVNHSTLAIVDGAASNQVAVLWDAPTDPDYDRVRDTILKPQGLSESQVQAVWIMDADRFPTVSLPSTSADAYQLEAYYGDIARAAKVRYPNLQIAFLGSRDYGGYANTGLNPEPYAYESGYAVKWLVKAQIDQMRNGGTVVDTNAGDLNYNTGVAPVLLWSAYTWANGTTPRSDGLFWVRQDFIGDGTHPSASGIQKVGSLLLSYFLSSPYTTWFLAAPPADFSLSASSASATVMPGQTATYKVSVTGTAGLNGTVVLTCAGAPSEATCSISPSSVTVNGPNPATATVTVTTTAASLTTPRPPAGPPRLDTRGPGIRLLWLLALSILAVLIATRKRRAFPASARWALGSTVVLALLWVACGGGGGSNSNTNTITNAGTPAGTYTLTVTGTYTSGSVTLQHTGNLTLTVQ